MRRRLVIAFAASWLSANVAFAADDASQWSASQVVIIVTSIVAGVGGAIVALLPKIQSALKEEPPTIKPVAFSDVQAVVDAERRTAANEHARLRTALLDSERDFGVALLRTDGRITDVGLKLEAAVKELAVIESRLRRQEQDAADDRKRLEELKETLHRLHVAVASAMDLGDV